MTSPAGAAMSSLSVQADPVHGGVRVDRFLSEHVPELTRSRAKTLITEGRLCCDGVPVRQPSEPVRPGARYELTLPSLVAAIPAPMAIPLRILFEDEHLVVLDKQAGLVVHPAPGNEDGTLVNALIAHCGASLLGIGGERRPGIVHRLDKDTSGVMVVAKTEPVLARLSADFAAREVERAYLALCWGMPSPSRGEYSGTIGRDPRNRKRMAVVSRGGKPALTRYRVRAGTAAAALLECRLATGRTHQIRVHLSQNGHPLVGDPLYLRRVPAASRLLDDADRRVALDFPRQALHAALLGFVHPATGADLRFSTSPPADLVELSRILLGAEAEHHLTVD